LAMMQPDLPRRNLIFRRSQTASFFPMIVMIASQNGENVLKPWAGLAIDIFG